MNLRRAGRLVRRIPIVSQLVEKRWPIMALLLGYLLIRQYQSLIASTMVNVIDTFTPTSTNRIASVTEEEKNEEMFYDSRPRLILAWTKMAGDDMVTAIGSELIHCVHLGLNCSLTADRDRLDDAHALLFHMADFDKDDVPQLRHQWQRYVFMSQQPPANMPDSLLNQMNKLPLGFFNWTMTYRRDSDCYRPFRVMTKIITKAHQQQILNSTTDLAITNSQWQQQHLLSNKHGLALFTDNGKICDRNSTQSAVIQELNSILPISQWSECKKSPDVVNRCRPTDKQCDIDSLIDDYKFYFAFENANCTGYVTERLISYRHTIPIVLNRSHYDSLPIDHHSFIAVDDYPSIGHLAGHMTHLAANQHDYNRYFQWQQTHRIESANGDTGLCCLCKRLKLIDNHDTQKVYESIYDWWISNSNSYNCQP